MNPYCYIIDETYYSPPGIEETGGYRQCLLCQTKVHWEAGSNLHTSECPKQVEKDRIEKMYTERSTFPCQTTR